MTNEEIVRRLPERDRLTAQLADLRLEISRIEARCEVLEQVYNVLKQVTCVHDGVALTIDESGHERVCLWAVLEPNLRRAEVYRSQRLDGLPWRLAVEEAPSFDGFTFDFRVRHAALRAAKRWVVTGLLPGKRKRRGRA